jgi:hypothetical protein
MTFIKGDSLLRYGEGVERVGDLFDFVDGRKLIDHRHTLEHQAQINSQYCCELCTTMRGSKKYDTLHVLFHRIITRVVCHGKKIGLGAFE